MAELKWSVKEYIQYAKKNKLNPQWIKELENASARIHISRLEMLILNCKAEITQLMNGIKFGLATVLEDAYVETFCKSVYTVQHGYGIGWSIAKPNTNFLKRIINKPWTHDGHTFSDRIWTNQIKLTAELEKTLLDMCLTGKAPQTAIKEFDKSMSANMLHSKSNVARLVMTEQAYFTSLAQKDSYDELDVEEVQIVATLDMKTCEHCGKLDKTHFPVKDMYAGINTPPFHPRCRCTTSPYFDDEWAKSVRVARNKEGEKTYYVPSDMTYTEWKKKYVHEE